MSAPYRDRWRDRFQVQLGVNWQLMPDSRDSWLEWAFSPEFGVTRVGQRFQPFGDGRSKLPAGPSKHVLVDIVDDMPVNEKTGLKPWYFVSRVFWIHGALRVLGFDVGAAAYWRKRYVPRASADTRPKGGDAQQAPFTSGAVPEGQTPSPSSQSHTERKRA